MRNGAVVLLALAAAAAIGLTVAAVTGERSQAFTLGVAASNGTDLPPDSQLCQAPIAVPSGAGFDGVTLTIAGKGRPGPPLDVSVRLADPREPFTTSPTVLARAAVPGGYPEASQARARTVWLAPVPSGGVIAVCVRNEGRRSALVLGDADAASRTTYGSLDGVPTGTDMAVRFERRAPRSLAALAPAILERAALFRPRWVGAATYWLLGALVLLAVPALLVAALRAAAGDTR